MADLMADEKGGERKEGGKESKSGWLHFAKGDDQQV